MINEKQYHEEVQVELTAAVEAWAMEKKHNIQKNHWRYQS